MVDYLVREVGDIKADIRQIREEMGGLQTGLRAEMNDLRTGLREEIAAIRQESRRDFRWTIGTFIGLMVPTWVLIAGVLIVGNQ